jgi:hypothetical protein
VPGKDTERGRNKDIRQANTGERTMEAKGLNRRYRDTEPEMGSEPWDESLESALHSRSPSSVLNLLCNFKQVSYPLLAPWSSPVKRGLVCYLRSFLSL